MLGILPVEAVIHKNMLNLFGSWIMADGIEKEINTAVHGVIETEWQEGIKSKSSLKYINPDSVRVGVPHHIWSSVCNNVHDSQRAQLKSRLLTGTYTLQSNRAVFSQFAVDPSCKKTFSGRMSASSRRAAERVYMYEVPVRHGHKPRRYNFQR